jgi:hypothetical protein
MNEMKIYTEEEIAEAIDIYSEFHEFHSEKNGGLSVHVTKNVTVDGVVGFRMSLDGDGRSRGCDEIIGIF